MKFQQKYCSNEKKQNLLSCLRRNANPDAMPNVCRRILYHRLMVLNSGKKYFGNSMDYTQEAKTTTT